MPGEELRRSIKELCVKYRGLTYNLGWRNRWPDDSPEDREQQIYSLWLEIEELAPVKMRDYLKQTWFELKALHTKLTLVGAVCLYDNNQPNFDGYCKNKGWPQVEGLLDELVRTLGRGRTAKPARRKSSGSRGPEPLNEPSVVQQIDAWRKANVCLGNFKEKPPSYAEFCRMAKCPAHANKSKRLRVESAERYEELMDDYKRASPRSRVVRRHEVA